VVSRAAMPRSKRPPALYAVHSPSARLPLGTPSFIRDPSPRSQHHHHQHQHQPYLTGRPARWTLGDSHDSSGSDVATPQLDSGNSSHLDLVMSSTHSNDANQTLSLAAAKLERQNKRIAATNATLISQLPAEKHKHSARSKAKAWKPFDFATEVTDTNTMQQIDAPVVETRVNVFRAQSQARSLSRPISRMSSTTHDSSYSELDRRDSSFLESDDFQVFTGRKKGIRPSVVPFTEKPSIPNATVEATFSKRDITDVFGNDLPGPSFMDGNPGTADGQLQFIQHPNGDVSAHQWSSYRFGWENIGQFSNIRKKIEGQLAAERLKGETAWQSLQQNTLAYFRTVAKQREADAMGLPFGVKDIAACLPDTRPPSTAPTGPRRVSSKLEMPERPSAMLSRQETQSSLASTGNREAPVAMPPKLNAEPLPRSQEVPPHQDQRLDPARYFTPAARENAKEDPFAAAASYNQSYGYNTRSTAYDQQMTNWSYQQPWNNMYYPGYAMPNTGYPNYGYIPHAPRPLYEQASTGDPSGQGHGVRIGQSHQMHQPIIQQQLAQHQSSFARESMDRPVTSVNSPSCPPRQAAVDTVQPARPAQPGAPKPSSPSPTRIAMREHVMKMGEQAKERNRSQGNIGRTVLYDPYQDQQKRDSAPPELVKKEPLPAPTTHTNALGYFPLLGLGMIPGLGDLSGGSQDPFPTTLAPSVKMPSDTPPVPLDSELRDSSPDRDWKRKTAKAASEHTASPPHVKKSLWDTDQLNDWLWSGNKFSRQEDFYERIIAMPATRTTKTTTLAIKSIVPPSRFNPPTPISKLSSPPTFTPQSNILTSRLLVPVLESLASYVQGPEANRTDYFTPWVKAPDWAIDRSATGNDSFFDAEWGQPPERLGRDPRYQPVPRGLEVRFGGFEKGRSGSAVAMPGLGGDRDRDGRRFGFGFGGRF
jgi:hypothetical protein